jgi:hypothetical protein
MKHILKSCGFLILVVLGSREGYAQTFPYSKATALQICKVPFTVSSITPKPASIANQNNIPTAANLKETYTAWYKFAIQETGNLEFTISPTMGLDDIDFVLMRQVNGQLVYMTSSISGPLMRGSSFYRFCQNGATGLKAGMSDEDQCNTASYSGATGFSDAVYVEKSQLYYLAINNYSSTGGFNVTWGNSTCDFYCSGGTITQGKQQSNNGVVGDPYPNPTTQFINLNLNLPASGKAMLRLIDMYGQILQQQEHQWLLGKQQTQFDTEALAKGTYMIDILLNDNEHYTRRFIKIE